MTPSARSAKSVNASGARLNGAVLFGADLRDADLRNASLLKTDSLIKLGQALLERHLPQQGPRG